MLSDAPVTPAPQIRKFVKKQESTQFNPSLTYTDKDGLLNIETLVIPVCWGGGVDGVPGRAAEHTYLLSLGFQGLQVVGHSFQLFLKLRAFAGVLHTEERRRKGTLRGGEPETEGHQGTGREERGTKETKPQNESKQGWGQGEPEVPLTQQECAMMTIRSLQNCCMQVVRSYTVWEEIKLQHSYQVRRAWNKQTKGPNKAAR